MLPFRSTTGPVDGLEACILAMLPVGFGACMLAKEGW